MNRTYLTLLALAGTLLGASLAASAQSEPPAPPAGSAPHGHRTSMLDRAMQGIALTPAEQSQVTALEEKFRASRKTDTPEKPSDLKADIDAALTPAHRTQFDANIAEMRAQRRAQREGGNAPASAPNPAAT